ncbi:hypothetical protein RJT34_20610 [Clitoria ternatea]|uniref:Alcohol dehydrogenase N-terminal domain-containing protein n=1 Tax=Clitoria ternatea TaxID=43366 RepID=A0AAN9P522_CLITE
MTLLSHAFFVLTASLVPTPSLATTSCSLRLGSCVAPPYSSMAALHILCLALVMESVGKDITKVTKGDVVIPIFLSDCGECVDYKSTKSNQCINIPFKVSPCMPRDGVGAAWRTIGAAWRTVGVESGSTVAIFGLGSVGLAICNLALYLKIKRFEKDLVYIANTSLV